jgi:hypothetical protein
MKQFKSGQKVRIRAWDDMVKEVGENKVRIIDLGIHSIFVGEHTFTSTMEPLSGRTHIVNKEEANKGKFYELYKYGISFNITPEMCEEVTDE